MIIRPDDKRLWNLDELDLRVFTHNQLKKGGIISVGQLLDKEVQFFFDLNPFSRKMFREVVERLDECGLRLKGYSEAEYSSIEPCIDRFIELENIWQEEENRILEEEYRAEKREKARIYARERRARLKAEKLLQHSTT